MFHAAYEDIVQFASQGDLTDELALARKEFIERTGDLFESDESYERRIAAFLEWYVLDRAVSFQSHKTPTKMYIDSRVEGLTTPEVTDLRQLTKTRLSLFEFKRAKGETLHVRDVLNNEKCAVFERRKPAGVESGDLFEARLVPHGETYMFSDAICYHPREARKFILKNVKVYRKNGKPDERVNLVHRVAYFSNRCERYKHVNPREIFAELRARGRHQFGHQRWLRRRG